MAAATQRPVSLGRMPQTVAAKLVGLPVSKLKDRPDLLGKNLDGTWNLEQLVRGLVTDYRPAKLTDAEVEAVLKVLDATLLMDVPSDEVGLLEAVTRRHGAAGLAAVGEFVIQHLRLYARPRRGSEARPEGGRYVVKCTNCRKYRWGPKWTRKNPKPDYPVWDEVCEECFM